MNKFKLVIYLLAQNIVDEYFNELNTMNLIESTFKRACDFLKANDFTILLEDNTIYLYAFYNPNDIHNWICRFNSKERFLLSIKNINKNVVSLFDISVFEYISHKEPYFKYILKDKGICTSFISICKVLKDCSCLEELNLKMDLMGI